MRFIVARALSLWEPDIGFRVCQNEQEHVGRAVASFPGRLHWIVSKNSQELTRHVTATDTTTRCVYYKMLCIARYSYNPS